MVKHRGNYSKKGGDLPGESPPQRALARLAGVRAHQIEALRLVNAVVGARTARAQDGLRFRGLVDAVFQQRLVNMHGHHFA